MSTEYHYNGQRVYVVQCSTSVKTEWRAFHGDPYTGPFLAEADTLEDAISAATLKIDDEYGF